MLHVLDFIRWALTHVNPYTVPHEAALARPWNECGNDPWHYLFGSHGHKTTREFIERRWTEHYSKQMTRAKYDAYTAGWKPTDTAADCEGLLDAWLTHVIGVATDINADMNYRLWCTGRGPIGEITRPWVIGEAVFHMNDAGRMTHVGWICGFREDSEPLVVEARGIAYGVVVTRLSKRDFTHRGLMTAKFDYSAADKPQEEKPMEPIVLKRTSPMMQGDGIRLMQQALNALGYTDDAGRQLDEDGKCGSCTMQAVQRFANAHTTVPVEHVPEEEPAAEIKPIMQYTKGDHGEYTVLVFNTADLPEAAE